MIPAHLICITRVCKKCSSEEEGTARNERRSASDQEKYKKAAHFEKTAELQLPNKGNNRLIKKIKTQGKQVPTYREVNDTIQ